MDVSLPDDKVRDATSDILRRLNEAIVQIKSFILIEDFIQSAKFAAGEYS